MRRQLAATISGAFLLSTLITPATAADFGPTSTLSAAGNDARDQAIASSDDGSRVTAVWVQTIGADERIVAASATVFAGVATWGATTTVSPAGVDAREPDLAVSSDGSVATVVWSQTSGATRVIKARTASIESTTQTWAAVQQPSTNALINDVARRPKVTMGADGQRAIAVWQRGDDLGPGKESVEAAIADLAGNAANWKNPTPVDVDNAAEPVIVSSRNAGRATVVWRDLDTDILVSRSGVVVSPLIVWGLPDEISAAGASQPALDATDDGMAAVAVWRQSAGAGSVIESNTSTLAGVEATWKGRFLVSEPNGNAGSPDVTLAATGGRAVAVWHRVSGADSIVQASLARIVGGQPTWGGRTALSPPGSDGFSAKALLSSDGSRAIAVWTVGSPNAVWTSSATISGLLWDWDTPTQLAPAASDASSPQLAASRDGDVLTVAWNAQLAGDSRIQAVSAAQPQTITFVQPADLEVNGSTALLATATSGLPVSVTSSTPAVCDVVGATVTALNAGLCSLTATAAGSLRFVAASPVVRNLTVSATPSPTPSATTTLTVKARKSTKKVRPRVRTRVVRSVVTNGPHTTTVSCVRKGRPAPKACRIRVDAAGQVLVRAKCRRNLSIRATVSAQAEGATPATWERRWRVRAIRAKGC